MPINEVQWSTDGRYVSIGGARQSQAICIAHVGEDCFENILRLIDAMKMNPRFWQQYPINLLEINCAVLDYVSVEQDNMVREQRVREQLRHDSASNRSVRKPQKAEIERQLLPQGYLQD